MSAKHLMPEVNAAVERLLELADRMKYEEFGFLDKDVVNIDKVIDSMHELEKERRGAHDLLETETIHASILRHKLQFLPPSIKSEIKERQHDLEGDYSTLLPERISASKEHEDIIQELNEKMAEKAGLQIVLNETRDQVRQTNQNIVDLEDGILQLKEDLIHERTEARHEKRNLNNLL
ncbi:unnamed protein product [Mytilus edulis]|uniref:Uncharacterized protein n=1 Tax=Mytilus edulis TaxID=6550 RepID=A0A8S3T868_MYTED|nr:unnamed protein product [Mytilus edulis]